MADNSTLGPGAFQWANDQPQGRNPKWGFISTMPGSVLRLVLNTTLDVTRKGQVRAAPSSLSPWWLFCTCMTGGGQRG